MLVMAGVFLAGICAFRWIKGFVHWISVAVFAIGALSLLDVRKAEGEPIDGGMKSYTWDHAPADVAGNFQFSTNKNVLVLIPDTMQANIADAIVRESPEIRKRFNGFIGYPNNIGMHQFTILGLPGIILGRHYDGTVSPFDYLDSITESGSLLADCAAAGDSVYAVLGAKHYSYSNKLSRKTGTSKPSTAKSAPFHMRQSGTPHLNLLDILLFRLAPFKAKAMVLGIRSLGLNGLDADMHYESALYTILANAPASGHRMTLGVFHTNGIHFPLCFDRHGNRISTLDMKQDYAAMHEQCYYVLDVVANLVDTLKERGLYDNTMIILTADHGSGTVGIQLPDGSNGKGAMAPMLWVKPFNTDSDFTIDKTPTSHVNIRKLVMSARENNVTSNDVTKLLKADIRLYREHHGGRLYDWLIDANGGTTRKESECRYKDAML